MKKKLLSIVLAAVAVLLISPVIGIKADAATGKDVVYANDMTTAFTNYYYGGLKKENRTSFKDIYENRWFFLCSQPVYDSTENAYSTRTAYFHFNNVVQGLSYVYSSTGSMDTLLYDVYGGGVKTTKRVYAFSKSARAENSWFVGSKVEYPAALEQSLYQLRFEPKDGAADNVGYLYLYQKPNPDIEEREGSDYKKVYTNMYIDYDTDKKIIYSRNDDKTEFTVNLISYEDGIYKMSILLNTYSEKNNVKAFLVMGQNGLEVQCTKTDGPDLYIYLGCVTDNDEASESQAYALVSDGSKKTLITYNNTENLDYYKDTSIESSFVNWISSASMASAYSFDAKNGSLDDPMYYWRGESTTASNFIPLTYETDPPEAHQAVNVVGIHKYKLNYEYTVENDAFGLEGITTGNLFNQKYDSSYSDFKSGDTVDQYNWVAFYFESAKICGYNAQIDEAKFYDSAGNEVTVDYTIKNDGRTLLINSMPGYDLTVKIKAHGEPAELDVNVGQYKGYVYDSDKADVFNTGYFTTYTTDMHDSITLKLSSDPEITNAMLSYSPGRWIYNSSNDLKYYSFKAVWYYQVDGGLEHVIGTSYDLQSITWSNHFLNESSCQVWAEITKSVRKNPDTYVEYTTDKITINFTYNSDPEIKLVDVDTTGRRFADIVIIDSNESSGSWARENIAHVYLRSNLSEYFICYDKCYFTGDVKSDNFLTGEEPTVYEDLDNFFVYIEYNNDYVIKVVNKNGEAKYAYLSYGNLYGGGEDDDNWWEFKDINTTDTKSSDLVVMYFKNKSMSGTGTVYIYDAATDEKYPGTLHVDDTVGTKSDDSDTVYTGTYYTFNITKPGKKLLYMNDAAGLFEYVKYSITSSSGTRTYYGTSHTAPVDTYNNINKVTSLAVTSQPTKKLYNLNERANFSGLAVTATFENGATLDVTKCYEYSGFDTQTPGTKTITVTYGGASATFEIEVKEYLKLTKPSTVTKTYDGTALSGKIGVNHEEGTTVTYYTKTSKSGEYGSGSSTAPTITDNGVLYVKAVAENPNYTQNSLEYTLTVNKKQLTVSGTSAAEKTYDGTVNAPVIVGTVTGIASGEDVTVSASGSFADKNAGEDQNVTVTYSLSGSKAYNYIVPAAETVKGTVKAKQLTTSSVTASSKVYDGTTACEVTVTTADIVAGDDVTITAAGTFAQSDVGDNLDVSVSFALTGSGAANYTKPADCTVQAAISQRTIQVYIDSKTTSVGADLAELTYIADPLCGSDAFTGELGTDADQNTAGTYAINAGTLQLSSNYMLNVSDGVYTVTGKTVQTIAFDTSAVTKVYGDGKFTKTVTGSNTSVVYESSDTSVAEVDGETGEVTIKKAGSVYITAKAAEDDTYGAARAGYILYVTKKMVNVPTAKTGLKYQGYEQTGVEANDSLYSISGNTAIDAGNYTAILSLKDQENCAWNDGSGTSADLSIAWSIAKRNVGLSSASASKEYDGLPLAVDRVDTSGDGFVETEGVLCQASASITEIGSVKNTFTYELNGLTKAGNYNITTIEGELTVTKALVKVPSAITGLVYDGAEKTGISIPENAKYTVTNYIKTDAGTYTAVASLTDQKHYAWDMGPEDPVSSDRSISWTIGQAAGLTISGTGYSGTYDGSYHGEKATAGIATGTAILYSVNGGNYSATVPQIKNVGTLNVTARATNKNYAAVECTYTLTVSPVTLSITGTTVNSKTYDGTYTSKITPGTLSGVLTIAGTVDDVSVDADNSYATLESKDVGDTIKATVSYVLKGDAAGNYVLPGHEATASIEKRTVKLTASSASKKYDGTALTSGDYTISGDGFAVVDGISEKPGTITMTGSATRTDVGTAHNVINTLTDDPATGFKKSNYSISYQSGTLEVTKRDVTLTAASATKLYDGLPLASGDYTVSGDGFAVVSGKSQEPSGVKMTAASTLTDAGTVSNVISPLTNDTATGFKTANYNITLVPGTLEVTKRNVTLTAASATKQYDGLALTSGDYTITGDGFAEPGGRSEEPSKVKMTADSTITDVGTISNEISTLTDDSSTGFKAKNYTVTLVPGTLEVTKRDVTLTAASATRKYDGLALTSGDYTVTGDGFAVVAGKSEEPSNVKMTEASTITDVGTAANEISTLTDDSSTGFKAENYNITLVPGTLEVTKRDVTLTAASATRKYDGLALTNGDYTVTGDGFAVVAGKSEEPSGVKMTEASTVTDVGTAANEISTLTDDSSTGFKVDNYNITLVPGTLEVTKRDVTLKAASAARKYNGLTLTCSDYTVSGDGFAEPNGKSEKPSNVKMTGTSAITNAGATKNVISVLTDDPTTGFKVENYNITLEPGILQVTKRDIILTAASASGQYNGKALTSGAYTIGGDGFAVVGNRSEEPSNIEMTKDSSLTGAGTASNEISVLTDYAATGFNTANYNITYVPGTLEVTKRNVTLTSASAVKVYDKEPLTADGVTVSGDGFAPGESATYEMTGSQTGPGECENTFAYTLTGGADAANYNITTVYGTLTVFAIDEIKSDVEIDGNSLKKSFTKGDTKDIVIEINDDNNDPIGKCSAVLMDQDGNAVRNCTCEKGSLKITIPNSFVKKLDVGDHGYILRVTNAADMTYDCILTISIGNPEEPAEEISSESSSKVILWCTLGLIVVSGTAVFLVLRKKKEER